MKTMTKTLVLFLAVLVSGSAAFGQATSSDPTQPGIANTPFSALDFLGWAPNVFMPLEIRTHEIARPQQINWFTQTLARLQIFEDPNNPGAFNAGFVGIGDFGFVSTPKIRTV